MSYMGVMHSFINGQFIANKKFTNSGFLLKKYSKFLSNKSFRTFIVWRASNIVLKSAVDY